MSKYLQVFKLAWQRNFEYRSNAIGHIILGLIGIVVPLFIFKYAFTQGAVFGDYTFQSMFTYLVMTKFMHFAGRGNIIRKISGEIKDGSFSNYQLKPISYKKYWFAYTISDRIFEILLRTFMLIIFLLIFPNIINLRSDNLLLFALIIPLTLLFNYIFSLIIASIAFFIVDIHMVIVSLGIVLGFLAGDLIPITLIPGTLGTLASWLPFRFLSYFPIMVYQGKVGVSEYWLGFLSLLLWTIVFAIVARLLWQKGVKHYEAVGR